MPFRSSADVASETAAGQPAGRPAGETIPVGVLVGFLGSGKTTTLNHLLKGVHGKKIAVVVNEFGAVDVDSALVAREVTADAELISLSNACICCKLRGDLLRAVHDLTERFDLDYILVESTGLGEAAPIAQTFFAPDLQGRVRLDAVIDVVDAAHFWDTYEDAGAEGHIAGDESPRGLAELLAGQIEFADVVLLNKTDLAGPEATTRLEAFVRELNPRARIQRTRFGDADPETLLYTGAFDLDAVEDTEEWQEAEEELEHDVLGAAGEHDEGHEQEDEHGDEHGDEHEDDSFGFASFVYETPDPLDLSLLQRHVFDRWGEVTTGIARSKGILHLAGSEQAVQWNQAGGRCALEPLGQWAPDSIRQTQLVFIGREADANAIGEALDACAVEGTTEGAGPPAGPEPLTSRVEVVLKR
jgi:G3E family GTPase